MRNNAENIKSLREKVFVIFGILMSLVYLSIGAFLIAVPEFLSQYPKNIKLIVGALFIVYALFRFARVIRSIRN